MGSGSSQLKADLERTQAQRDKLWKDHEQTMSLLEAERAKTKELNSRYQESLLKLDATTAQLNETVQAFKAFQAESKKNIEVLERENARLREKIESLDKTVKQLMAKMEQQQRQYKTTLDERDKASQIRMEQQQLEYRASLDERDKANQMKLEEMDKKSKIEQFNRDEANKKIIADRDAMFEEKFNMMMARIAQQNAAKRTKRSTLKQASRQLGMVNEFARRFHEERLQEIQSQNSSAGTGGVKLAAMLAEADKKFEDEIKMLKKYVVSRANPTGKELQRMVDGVREGLVSKYDLRGGRGFGSAVPSGHASPAYIQGMNMQLLG
ncbi:hypothetical protein HDE_02264 [Halotydeus destructor]|nr:hypothetical protein HDE_02264 [Halotydeus destructor]